MSTSCTPGSVPRNTKKIVSRTRYRLNSYSCYCFTTMQGKSRRAFAEILARDAEYSTYEWSCLQSMTRRSAMENRSCLRYIPECSSQSSQTARQVYLITASRRRKVTDGRASFVINSKMCKGCVVNITTCVLNGRTTPFTDADYLKHLIRHMLTLLL